jgi:hypothetical protein
MLNPSTADAARDDPTIRSCVHFTRQWGYGGLVVVNLFAWRATDPAELVAASDPVGPANDATIARYAMGRRIIAAWGSHGELLDRDCAVLEMLGDRRRIACLGLTASGKPRHPLYSARDTVPQKIRRFRRLTQI